jgi:hypothetical protein
VGFYFVSRAHWNIWLFDAVSYIFSSFIPGRYYEEWLILCDYIFSFCRKRVERIKWGLQVNYYFKNSGEKFSILRHFRNGEWSEMAKNWTGLHCCMTTQIRFLLQGNPSPRTFFSQWTYLISKLKWAFPNCGGKKDILRRLFMPVL